MIDPSRLLKWFEGLSTRTLDLIGDYAGDELFILEGDSLLLNCFCDDQLDFAPGLQMLHATYLVEKFLSQLYQRKCAFHIVFFSENYQACVPPHANDILRQKYLLTREAILQHLQQNLSNRVPNIQVKCFGTYKSAEFRNHIQSVGAYFLMCHDGSFLELECRKERFRESKGELTSLEFDDFDSEETDEDSEDESFIIWPNTIILRSMIHWFICNGYNISLINSLEFRDTKVMSMIMEGSASHARQLDNISCLESKLNAEVALEEPESSFDESSSVIEVQNDADASQPTFSPQVIGIMRPESSSKSPVNEHLFNLASKIAETPKPDLTQREMISLFALSVMLQPSHLSGFDLLPACAMLLQTVILGHCKLDERASNGTISRDGSGFLANYTKTLLHILSSTFWTSEFPQKPKRCDIADLIDGRLFYETLNTLKSNHQSSNFSLSILSRFEELSSMLFRISKIELILKKQGPTSLVSDNSNGPILQDHKVAVLPFSNKFLDHYLSPISLVIENSPQTENEKNMSRVFEELSHWHNHKRVLNPKAVTPVTEREKFFINRRNQNFMTEVRQYAASLTNSSGGILEPETVFVRSAKDPKNSNTHEKKGTVQGVSRFHKKEQKVISSVSPAGSQKREKAEKKSVRDQVATLQQSKQEEAAKKHLKAWENMVAGFEAQIDYITRYTEAKQFLSSLPQERRNTLEVEILAYLVNTLVLVWKERCDTNQRDSSIQVVAIMWHIIQQIAKAQSKATKEIAAFIHETIKVLHLPPLEITTQLQRPPTFQFASFAVKKANINIGISAIEFQLIHAGPYLDRSMGSAPDSRVHDFEPDKWQRDILDEIDARRSLFVVAPTSAGKTFISFYAIKQVLEDDNDGVLVYVAPTKALVNQIAAEIQARFSKCFNNLGGKSVWAIHTRDYRINNPDGCQVLITVPHILQIMLLAPSNARTWSPRVRRIIFDEIHCIGQAQDGVIWEQLLLLSPCPIIALSATVGNPQEFNNWLGLTQKVNGTELKMIQHTTRYSDLRKYTYHPPDKFSFHGLATPPQLAALGLDNCPNLAFLHPAASLIDRSRGLPDDLIFEPRDCLMLWSVMRKHQTKDFQVDESLSPESALPKIICKSDIIEWETRLKSLLRDWMEDNKSPFEAVIKDLSKGPPKSMVPSIQISSRNLNQQVALEYLDKSNILDTTLPLICSLHDQGALPALIFNYDRSHCEKICERLLNQLEHAENRWKATEPLWKKKLEGWEKWLDMRQRTEKQRLKEYQKMSQTEELREAASKESNYYESFDPDEPIEGFHLADIKKLTRSEFQEYAATLRARLIPEWLIRSLKRGIGVHHAGMNRKYRQVCEILFRKGYLRVVIATGTLALGINMPCKTVVFSGDSVYLTALSFRQAAGRAGRRGFDFLGNVVFQGVSYAKVCRLLSSRLPNLNGHFPITTSMVLRLFILLHESKQAPYAVKAINSILSCPRIYLGGPESRQTVLHHLRFSIEYLRRNNLLDQGGVPLNFAGTVSHLYYTENSSFAFHALLSEGYFHDLCRDIDRKPQQTLLRLILVMAHLFRRLRLRPSVVETQKSSRKNSPSVVILPPLPRKAMRILDSHNRKTLDTYSGYVATFVDQHIHAPDRTLPFTGVSCGGDHSAKEINPSMGFLPATQVNSAFVALSGHQDKWESISELCKMIRSGVWLEQAVIPHVEVSPGQNQAPLNAYIYDFFKHGNIHALMTANMIRRGDIWFLLNDFSLVLATIVTSLQNFLSLSPQADLDLLETMGSGDTIEEEQEDKVFEEADKFSHSSTAHRSTIHHTPSSPVSSSSPRKTHPSKSKSKSKPIVESWEDELSDTNGDDKENMIPETLHDAVRQRKKEKKQGKSKRQEGSDPDTPAEESVLNPTGLLQVLKGFKKLQEEFNVKFKAIWA